VRQRIENLLSRPGYGGFRGVKPIVFLVALACPVQAALLATFQTTQGNVIVELQYATAPQAVANFITLAEGTRAWVDPHDGWVRKAPFYNGIKIHRTANDSGFKFAQGGSPKGDGSDGPGYTFKDEFNASETHVPYVISMANSGPNTNGSQFFFTGSLSQPSFNNVHTIFGHVTDPASRGVVDAMIAAGPGGTTINQITISRTDAAALAFNEQAQNLPIVTQPDGSLTVTPGVSATWRFQQLLSTGAVFRAFRSTTLAPQSWTELDSAELHVGIGTALLTPVVVTTALDNASSPSAFYNLSVARHPDSVAPSSLASRTVGIGISGGVIYYAQNSAGTGGTATFYPNSGSPLIFPFNTYSFSSGAHEVVFIAENIGISPDAFLIKIGCDSAINTEIDGHHATQYYDPIYGWQPYDKGQALISR
jgi:cyclophilin family peptidyl-prolyl cis-trans isomerase